MYTIGNVTKLTMNTIKDDLIKYNIPIGDQFKASFERLAKQQIHVAYDSFIAVRQNSCNKSTFFKHNQTVTLVQTAEKCYNFGTFAKLPIEILNHSNLHSEIMLWTIELAKYFDKIRGTTETTLHVIDQRMIQENLLCTDEFKEYFTNAACLQISGAYERFLAQEISSESYKQNEADVIQSRRANQHFGKNNILVSLSITQQQMQITFTAEQKAQCIDVEKLLPSSVDSIAVDACFPVADNIALHTKENQSHGIPVDNRMKAEDHEGLVENLLKPSVDRSTGAMDYKTKQDETQMNKSKVDKFIGKTKPFEDFINIVDGDHTDGQIYSKKPLKRKIHNGNGGKNRMRAKKMKRKSNVFDMKKYDYNFRKLFLKKEPPLKRYLSPLKKRHVTECPFK